MLYKAWFGNVTSWYAVFRLQTLFQKILLYTQSAWAFGTACVNHTFNLVGEVLK